MSIRILSAALFMWVMTACSTSPPAETPAGSGLPSVTPGMELPQAGGITPTQSPDLPSGEGAPEETLAGVRGTPTSSEPAAGLPPVEQWVVYRAPAACIDVPVPPGWYVLPWGFEVDPDPGGFYDTTSFVAPEMHTSGAPQPPAISVVAFSDPLQTDIQDWLADHSTTEPFGTEVNNPLVRYYGVQNARPATLASQPAVQFEHDVMGLRFREALSSHNNVVYALSAAMYGDVDLTPVFETMLQNLQADDRSCPPLP